MSIVVIEPDELQEMISQAVDKTVSAKVPEIVKQITEDEWLTTEAVEKEFKLSRPQQKHYRDTRQIPFTKHNRKIFYKRADVVEFMECNQIPRRENG
ncbi:MAG: helix-turn-helix domain-containing protein [Candidatus Marinimicrobia bacterium]|nr:helix-turn-helix domain-containing protein [Candidatus Neomarinimicrobiota bacterium]MCF7828287.1 helix-turn-helix domain-containing protein [Candidatus Neomarinimicrobiota bacterium]MCF7879538.1 helix-turn-helix domain-containing protein [Candidatus Neomarinimicrobiota bacterium]